MNSANLRRGFGSDNHSGVHPEVLQALLACQGGHAPSYGIDPWCEQAEKEFRQHFGSLAEIFFVYNGTAANVLCLRAMTDSYNTVLCSDTSHLHHDECGAPELFTRCKVIALPSVNGKTHWPEVEKYLVRRGDQHYSQPKVISLTQPTELGTLYTVAELTEICQKAHAHGLLVHVDGARLSNAVVALNSTFHELLVQTGVDAVSFGGTKNGLMFGEAVIFLQPELARNAKFYRKQALQLPSKSRFIGAQFSRYLQDGLWREIAAHSLQMAQRLQRQIKDLPRVEVIYPVESNVVFAKIPKEWVGPLRKRHFFYVWDEKTFVVRLMTTYDTATEDIDSLAQALHQLQTENP